MFANMEDSEKVLEYNLEVLERELIRINMKIKTEKTKSMIQSKKHKLHKYRRKPVEQVEIDKMGKVTLLGNRE